MEAIQRSACNYIHLGELVSHKWEQLLYTIRTLSDLCRTVSPANTRDIIVIYIPQAAAES
jgi:hypothetical protein